jgi:hypothetical protein
MELLEKFLLAKFSQFGKIVRGFGRVTRIAEY